MSSDSQSDRPLIGVIGGMGPHAGLDLVRKIFDQTVAASDQAHVPVALLSYPNVPDRTAYLLGDVDENPARRIAHVAARLDDLGATVAGIACNTAHAPEIFENVVRHLSRAGRRIRILHLIDETVDAIREAHGAGTRVGILSTMGSYRVGLYREAAAAGGLQPVEPTPEVQESVVHRSVYDPTFGVKAQPTRVFDEARALADAAVRHLAERGAEIVVLGCTELPSVLPDATCHGLPVIDPATVLARALLRATYPAKLRPEPAVAG